MAKNRNFSKNENSNRMNASNANLILYGRHAVLAAIANPNRKISKILVTKDNFDEIKAACQKSDLNIGIINTVDKKEIDRVLPNTDVVHQCIVAYTKELDCIDIDDVVALSEDKDNCNVLILDQVTDPQNIGAIIRTCAAFDALALIVQDKNSPPETGAMAKASVGAIDVLPICRVTNLSRAIQQLQEAGFWAIGMDGEAKITIDKVKKGGKNVIVMGSEGKGMRRLVEENCDIVVKLPISGKVESLNVSTAAAIALYEMSKI